MVLSIAALFLGSLEFVPINPPFHSTDPQAA
jgi:hypothetical protein